MANKETQDAVHRQQIFRHKLRQLILLKWYLRCSFELKNGDSLPEVPVDSTMSGGVNLIAMQQSLMADIFILTKHKLCSERDREFAYTHPVYVEFKGYVS